MAAAHVSLHRRAILLLGLALAGAYAAAMPVAAQVPSADTSVQIIVSPDPVDPAGSVTYTITASNSGPDAAANVSVTDALPPELAFASMIAPPGWSCTTPAIGSNGTVDCSVASLSAGTSATLILGATVIGAPNGGTVITNSASISATTADPNSANQNASADTTVATPSVLVDLNTVMIGNSDSDGTGSVTPGDQLDYQVTATNAGNVTLTHVVVSDDHFTATMVCASLLPGDSCVLFGSYTVTFADQAAGHLDDTGTVTANELGAPITSTASTLVDFVASPAMTLDKLMTGSTDVDASGTITEGDVLAYTVTATDIGNTTLTNLEIDDTQLTPNFTICSGISPSQTCVLSGSHTVTHAEAIAGKVVNAAIATAIELASPVSSLTVTTPVAPLTAMTVDKVLLGIVDNDSSGDVTVGDQLDYAVTAHNAGTTTLTGVVVSDDHSTDTQTCDILIGFTDCVFNVSYVVTANDVLAKQVINIGSATSNEVPGPLTATVTTPVAAAPPTLSIVSGDGLAGYGGQSATLVVELRDSSGNPVSGATINWTGANFGTTTTDANGRSGNTVAFNGVSGFLDVVAAYVPASLEVHFTLQSVSAHLNIVSGDGQTGPANSVLPLPLVVVAADDSNPAATSLSWTVNSGQAMVSPTSNSTDDNGEASATVTFGSTPGPVQVTVVRADGSGESVVFNLSSISVNRTLVIQSGNDQSGAPGSALPLPLVVHAQDNGADAGGVGISWSVVAGVASIAPSGATDATGLASANITLGATPDPVSIRAARSDDPSVFVLFTASTAKLQLAAGLSADELKLAVVLDETCASLAGLVAPTPQQADLLARCQQLIAASLIDPNAAVDALDELLPGIALVTAESAFNAAQAQFQNLKVRIAALRSGTQGASFNGLALTGPGGTIPLGALAKSLAGKDESQSQAGSEFWRWGFFAAGTIGRGEAEQGSSRPAYDYDINGLTAGVDYRYSDKLILGGALGYTRQDTDLAGARGKIDMRGWSVSAYATYYQDDSWYTDAVLTWGSNQFDLLRRITYTLPLPGGGSSVIDQTARSSADGRMREAAFTFGRDFQVRGWSMGPYGRVLYTRLDFDSIREDLDAGAGSGLGLAVDARSLTSLASDIGAKFTYAHSADWGVLTPHLQVEWEHEFKDDPKALTARFLADPDGTPFSLSGEKIDSDYFRVSLGLSLIMPRGRSGFVLYERTVGRNGLSQDNLGFGIRIEF